MTGWGIVAGVVTVWDVLRGRRGESLLSHDWWRWVESEHGAVPFGVLVTVGWHLTVPWRSWWDAIKIGALAAVAHRITRP